MVCSLCYIGLPTIWRAPPPSLSETGTYIECMGRGYNTLLNAYAKDADGLGAQKVFDEMRSHLRRVAGRLFVDVLRPGVVSQMLRHIFIYIYIYFHNMYIYIIIYINVKTAAYSIEVTPFLLRPMPVEAVYHAWGDAHEALKT